MKAADPSRPTAGALFTDLYELTMLQAYRAEGMDSTAVFELFFRELPEQRAFAIAAGLEDVLAYLEGFRFEPDELAWLERDGRFSSEFITSLGDLRFTGDVHAVPEGTLVFPHEPVVQVVAPIAEAQIIETFALNQIHLQTVLASKAARVVIASQGRDVVDFGSRRAHGSDAALKAARCAYLVGAAGTSNIEAARLYDVPAVGTMAHSYIQAHDSELGAFDAFAREFPGTTLLVDTYDTLAGVEAVIELARRPIEPRAIDAIRLDSGELLELSRAARARLDSAGLEHVEIVASGGLNEHRVARLVAAGAPIDSYGVGTDMVLAADAPTLDFAYKLVEYDGRPTAKYSPAKVLLPGRKQVFRRLELDQISGDTLGLANERLEGAPLLEHVMENGTRCRSAGLKQARRRAMEALETLPPQLRELDPNLARPPYSVDVSAELTALAAGVRAEVLPSPSTTGASPRP